MLFLVYLLNSAWMYRKTHRNEQMSHLLHEVGLVEESQVSFLPWSRGQYSGLLRSCLGGRAIYSDHLKTTHSPEAYLWHPGNTLQSVLPPFYGFPTEQCKTCAGFSSSVTRVYASVCICLCRKMRTQEEWHEWSYSGEHWHENVADTSHTWWFMSHSTSLKYSDFLWTWFSSVPASMSLLGMV